ncbi:MAG TPA: DUF4239 domain-containing protein [Thermoanaerobaculia bacterium]|nr:DUF4239 domain-containing protein [Thermoanaerobaculia bacterium]HQR67160.1 DUF4239 domain-containing protein [Thermoanaerobaculia bacterium]
MLNAVGAFLTFAITFGAMLAFIAAGRRFGRRALAGEEATRPAGLGTVETVAFALLGLLLAFTFSGAAQRLDTRRAQIVEEANDVGTAWLRLDLLPASAQPRLREAFRRYVDARLAHFRGVAEADFPAARAAWDRSAALQNEIWADAVTACREAPPQASIVLLPALNAMFDITTTRAAARDMHPPKVVFVVLFAIALVCALLVGYEMGASPTQSPVHIWAYAAILAFTLYVILDFEYPRLGLIRIDEFDKYLIQVREAMK